MVESCPEDTEAKKANAECASSPLTLGHPKPGTPQQRPPDGGGDPAPNSVNGSKSGSTVKALLEIKTARGSVGE